MVSKYLKILPLFLISTLFLPTSAMADWPVAIVDNVAVHPAQSSIRIDPLENDIGDNLEIVGVNEWSENGAQISIVEDHLSYIPPKEHAGEDGFWYAIKDDQGQTNSVRVVVDVKSPDSQLPAPQKDFIRIPINQSVRIDVLQNDLFSTTTLAGQSTSGGVISSFEEWSTKGGQIKKIVAYPDAPEALKYHLLYTPRKGFTGKDTFSYSVKDLESDLTGTAEQSIKVTVKVSKNHKILEAFPTAKPDAIYANCNEAAVCDNSLNYVLRNDIGKNLILKLGTSPWSDVGGRISISLTESGVARIHYIAPIPRLIEKAAEEGIYEDTVYYVIEDQYGRQNYGVLKIDLTGKPTDPKDPTAPVAVADTSTTPNNKAININVLDNDSDPNSDFIFIANVTQGSQGGEVTITSDGEVRFIPAVDFVGTEIFTYTVSDGNETDTGIVTVTVTDIAGSVYLNIDNISVAVGAGTDSSGSLNNTLNGEETIDKVIDAPSADTEEFHNQTTHIYFTAGSEGGGLELSFDFRQPYDISTLHFWNFDGEAFDVDNIDFTFFDQNNVQVSQLSIQPSLGEEGSLSNSIVSEDINLSVPSNVQFVRAFLTGTNGNIDFQNIGFTAEASQTFSGM